MKARRTYPFLSSVLCTILLWASPDNAAAHPSTDSQRVQRAITVSGRIDRTFVDRTIGFLIADRTINTVFITSLGGDTEEAIRLGRVFLQRKIAVVAQRACISACAQYLFLPNQHRSTFGTTLVALHNTATDAVIAMQSSGVHIGEQYYNHLKTEEDALYRQAGIPLNVLSLGIAGLDIRCVALSPNKDLLPFQRISIEHTFVTYTVSSQSLKGLGVKGNLAAFGYNANMDSQLIRNAGLNDRFTINHLGDSSVGRSLHQRISRQITQC